MSPLPRIAITMGDPAGIGPEVALAALASEDVRAICTPILIGDRAVLEAVAQAVSEPVHASFVPEAALYAGALPDEACVVDCACFAAGEVQPGKVHARTGQAAYRFIESAIRAALAGTVEGVATGPIHKEALRAAGISHAGHTEIFQELTGAPRVCMMLTSDALTCSFVTTHIGYHEVPAALSMERILETIALTAEARRRMLGREPRLLVNALNPHGGEGGLFGQREEERFIIPAIEAARGQGIDVSGPFPPDTAFLPTRRAESDAFICMYHDQGHIPLKMLAFDTAVNTTLGLPIIRTSVDHGTALDIAWQGQARSSSLVQAIILAVRLARG